MSFWYCLKCAYKWMGSVFLMLAALFGPVLLCTYFDRWWIFLFSFITVPLAAALLMYVSENKR